MDCEEIDYDTSQLNKLTNEFTMENDTRLSQNISNDYPPYYPETFKMCEIDNIICTDLNLNDSDFNKITENLFGSILYEFDILENEKFAKKKGYITTENGERSIIISDCGGFHVSCKKVLEEKIAQYKQAIQETEKALYLFENIK